MFLGLNYFLKERRSLGLVGEQVIKKASSDRLQQNYSWPCEWLPFHLDCSQLSWIMKSQERDGSA